MQDYYDITESLFSAKANEGMIAFAGFLAQHEASVSEGVLKIAAFRRADGNGYLTLTFVIDLEVDSGRKVGLQSAFARASQNALVDRLGPDFEMLLDVPLNPFAESSRFFVEELNLYFKHLAGRERWLLETYVMPALSELIGLRCEGLEWLSAAGVGVPSPGTDVSDSPLRREVRRQLEGNADRTPIDPRSGRE